MVLSWLCFFELWLTSWLLQWVSIQELFWFKLEMKQIALWEKIIWDYCLSKGTLKKEKQRKERTKTNNKTFVFIMWKMFYFQIPTFNYRWKLVLKENIFFTFLSLFPNIFVPLFETYHLPHLLSTRLNHLSIRS